MTLSMKLKERWATRRYELYIKLDGALLLMYLHDSIDVSWRTVKKFVLVLKKDGDI